MFFATFYCFSANENHRRDDSRHNFTRRNVSRYISIKEFHRAHVALLVAEQQKIRNSAALKKKKK